MISAMDPGLAGRAATESEQRCLWSCAERVYVEAFRLRSNGGKWKNTYTSLRAIEDLDSL